MPLEFSLCLSSHVSRHWCGLLICARMSGSTSKSDLLNSPLSRSMRHLLEMKLKYYFSVVGKRPFECDACGSAFARLASLNKHKDALHKGKFNATGIFYLDLVDEMF